MARQESALIPASGAELPQQGAPGLPHAEPAVNLGRGERLASLVLGAVLLGLGLRRRAWRGVGMVLGGGVLLERGRTGHCPVYAALGSTAHSPDEPGVSLSCSTTVLLPRAQVYRAWRSLEAVPRFSRYVRQVRELGGGRSHWVAQGLGGTRLEWTAELTEERPEEHLGWRTLPGARLQHAGSVSFHDAPGALGTEVVLQLHAVPPGGRLGLWLARLVLEEGLLQLEGELRRFEALLEAGVPAVDAPPPAAQRSWLGGLMAALVP